MRALTPGVPFAPVQPHSSLGVFHEVLCGDTPLWLWGLPGSTGLRLVWFGDGAGILAHRLLW